MRDSLLRVPFHNNLEKTYEITLSNGKKSIIDEDDIGIARGYNWTYVAGYAGRAEKKNGVRKSIKLHREIMKCPVGFVVDHINGDTLDNRKINMRICTQAENIMNSSKHNKKKYTLYKGVYKNGNRFFSSIQANKKTYHLGSFKYDSDAAYAYDKAAEKFHGEFAKLNRPYDNLFASLSRALDDFETKRDNASDIAEREVFEYVSNQVKLILDDSPKYLKETFKYGKS